MAPLMRFPHSHFYPVIPVLLFHDVKTYTFEHLLFREKILFRIGRNSKATIKVTKEVKYRTLCNSFIVLFTKLADFEFCIICFTIIFVN